MCDDECCESSFNYGSRAEGVVRYGNTITLYHLATGKYLNSDEYTYQSGSYQQRVYANDCNECDAEWIVLPIIGSDECMGNEVGFDDPFRLKHVRTGRYLHSHPDIASPASEQQEVTAFGSDEESDQNDVWRLEALPEYEYPEEDYLWHLDLPHVIRHVETNLTLHSHDIEFEGSNEVTAYPGIDENDQWAAN
ncbi:MIR motif-containing protein [Dichotomocladium elegans]|nr:MIR motif-containing protein [Dichotomocladium elegans]